MFLAPSPKLRACKASKVETEILVSKVNAESPARSSQYRSSSPSQLGRPGYLGVPIGKCETPRNQDSQILKDQQFELAGSFFLCVLIWRNMLKVGTGAAECCGVVRMIKSHG
jgi:hypothetical protein